MDITTISRVKVTSVSFDSSQQDLKPMVEQIKHQLSLKGIRPEALKPSIYTAYALIEITDHQIVKIWRDMLAHTCSKPQGNWDTIDLMTRDHLDLTAMFVQTLFPRYEVELFYSLETCISEAGPGISEKTWHYAAKFGRYSVELPAEHELQTERAKRIIVPDGNWASIKEKIGEGIRLFRGRLETAPSTK